MKNANTHEAETRLSVHLDIVESEKNTIVICRNGGPIADLELWKTKSLKTRLNAAVLPKGYLYGVDGDTNQEAPLKCIDFATREEEWSEPEFGSGGRTIVDGHLLALSGLGEVMIAPASAAEVKPTAYTQVFGPKALTAPVFANGLLYCRNGRGELVVLNFK